MKKLYRFSLDCGRSGNVTSVFVADDSAIAGATGKEVCFGEVLGKHSEVWCTLGEGNLATLTDDQDFIEKFELLVGHVGRHPLKYLREDWE